MIPEKRGIWPTLLLLIPASFFAFFSNGRWMIAVAAWLYPVFMIRFVRRQNPLAGYLIAAAVIGVVSQVAFWKFASSDPGSVLFYLPFFLGFLMALPFLADRLLHRWWGGFVSTLIFPAAYTAVEFFYALINPLGTSGILAYSQYRIFPLVQLVSVTGIWGLTFLITWFGSLANHLWDHMGEKKEWKKGLLVYGVLLASVLLYGGIRLALPGEPGTVRIAGVHVYDLRGPEGRRLMDAALHDRDTFRTLSVDIQDRAFDAAVREARAGAEIVLFSEILPAVAAEDEPALIRRAEGIAKAEGIYLLLSEYVSHDDPRQRDENKLLLLGPEGQTVITHYKFGGNLVEGTIKGDGVLQTADTPYGRISGAICWDQDFPQAVRQAGQKRVDIMLAPSADWREIDPLHSIVGYFRSVENGYALCRQTINGLSLVTDGKGNILAAMDHFQSDEWVTVAQVPTHGVWTLYSAVGDTFGWLAVAGVLYFIVLGVWRKRKS